MREGDQMKQDVRPDPDALLRETQREEPRRGTLKIFLGYAPGVGKTYAMLQEAHVLGSRGEDVVVGIVETHGRVETQALLDGLEVIPPKTSEYQGMMLEELDIGAVLQRKPAIVLIDELAHTNAPGSRHPKRYQDAEDLIENGIGVYTTVNIQHFESQVDTVAQITGVRVQETVPDTILEKADEVQVIDIPLEELNERLREGKVYVPEQARRAMKSFFQRGNLVALRELTLTLAARKMGSELVDYMRSKAISGPWPAGERVLVCIGHSPYAPQLLRKAYTIAKDANAEWYAIYVASPSFIDLSEQEKTYLSEALNLAEELGANVATVTGSDAAEEILRFGYENNITRIVVGKPLRSKAAELLKPSPVHKLLHAQAPFEFHLITPLETKKKTERAAKTHRSKRFAIQNYLFAIAIVAFITLIDLFLQRLVNPSSLVFIYLIATIAAALRVGMGPSLFAAILSLLTFDFIFTEPRYSFSMYHGYDIVNTVVFLFTSFVVSQLVKINKRQDYALHLRLQRVTLVEEMSKEFLALPPVEQLVGGFTQHTEEWMNILPLLRTTVLDDISHIIIKYVKRVVEQPSFVLFTGQDGRLRVWAGSDPDTELDPHEVPVAEWTFTHGEMAGSGTQTLAGAQACFLPLKSGDDVVGVIGITYEYKNLLMDQRRLLGAIASLAALGAIRWAKA
jgi:two-component system, OmpR family, sensor histidine kinase KdpD